MVIACDNNPEWTKIAQKYWQLANQADKIKLKLAPAVDTLNVLLQEGGENTYDFVFIDADKKNYKKYYELSLALLRKGGVIAIDNVLWDGKVANPSADDENTVAIREINEQVLEDDRVSMSMIPIADGLTLVKKL